MPGTEPLSTSDAQGRAAPERRARGAGVGPLAVDLRIAIMRTSRRLRAEAASRSLSPGQYSVLAAIIPGSMSVGQLAEREQIQAPSMTRIVNHLQDAGLVIRCAGVDDKRRVLVQITEAGSAALAAARSKRTEWLAKRVAALSPEDRRILRQAARILQEMSSK